MKERPILMTGESVQAILNGTKTQTRRVFTLPKRVDPQAWRIFQYKPSYEWEIVHWPEPTETVEHVRLKCPYGVPGDRLWVKEAWRLGTALNCPLGVAWMGGTEQHARVVPHPESPKGAEKWCLRWVKKSSLFMPRWASRIDLKIVRVRLERVQDIDEWDAMTEGVKVIHKYDDPVRAFATLWDSINAKRGYPWASNPWVWVVEFGVIKP